MQLTNLGRRIDLNHPTNAVVTLLSCLALTAGFLYQFMTGAGWLQALMWGARLGLTLFLAWALAREVDPDQPLAAFPGAGIALFAAVAFGMPDLVAALWSILILRVVNRCVGKRASWFDSLSVLGLGSFLAYKLGWPYGFASGLAFAMDSRLPKPHRKHLWFANAALLVTLAAAVFGPQLNASASWTGSQQAAVFGTAVLFAVVIFRSRRVTSVADRTGEQLQPLRVQSAQILGLVTGMLGAWWGGWNGVIALGPLWSALLGVGIYQILVVLPGAILRGRAGAT